MDIMKFARPLAQADTGAGGGGTGDQNGQGGQAGAGQAGAGQAGAGDGTGQAGAGQAGAGQAGAGQAGAGQQGQAGANGQAGQGQGGEFALEVPEGYAIDDASKAEVLQFVKDTGLPPEKAKAAVGLHMKMIQKQYDNWVDSFNKQVDEWEAKVQADPVIGKPENLAIAKLGMEKTMSPDLQQLLRKTGLGSHPDMIKHLYDIGLNHKEDNFPGGAGSGGGGAPTAAQVLYGEQGKG